MDGGELIIELLEPALEIFSDFWSAGESQEALDERESPAAPPPHTVGSPRPSGPEGG